MNWFVLYVKTRQELKIQNYLKSSNLNIEVFCPTRFEIKQWSDRKKKIKRPLLPNSNKYRIQPGIEKTLSRFSSVVLTNNILGNKGRLIFFFRSLHCLTSILVGQKTSIFKFELFK